MKMVHDTKYKGKGYLMTCLFRGGGDMATTHWQASIRRWVQNINLSSLRISRKHFSILCIFYFIEEDITHETCPMCMQSLAPKIRSVWRA